MDGAWHTPGKMRNAYTFFVKIVEGERPLERPKHRQEYTIKMYLKERGYAGFIWLRTAMRWALVNTVMNLQAPKSSQPLHGANVYILVNILC
jgi:hypothetical protein